MTHFIDTVNIIIDGGKILDTVRIGGGGDYDQNVIKKHAEKPSREKFPNSKITSVILNHEKVDSEQYKKAMGDNPLWLSIKEK